MWPLTRGRHCRRSARPSIGNRDESNKRKHRKDGFGYSVEAIEEAIHAIDEKDLRSGKFDLATTKNWFCKTFLGALPCERE